MRPWRFGWAASRVWSLPPAGDLGQAPLILVEPTMTDTTARALADLVTLTPGGRAVPGHLTTPDLPGNLPVAVVDADRSGAITLIRPEADLWPTAAVIP